MNNFALGWRNHLLYETGASIGMDAGTVSAGPLENLLDMRLSKRATMTATSDSGGNAIIEATWAMASGTVSVDLVGLLNYAVSAPDAASVAVSLTAYGPSDSYQENAIWTRPSADFPLHAWVFCPDRIQASEIRLQVTALFGGAGETLTLTAGGLWAGPVWSPPDGIEATWAQSIVDRGTVGRSEGGQGYPRRRQRYRSFEGRAINVPFDWAFGDAADSTVLDIQQLLYRIGTTEPVALFPRTQDATGALSTHVIHRLGIYGHMVDPGRIEHLGGDLYQWAGVRVDELM
jgi:hypothetical protein